MVVATCKMCGDFESDPEHVLVLDGRSFLTALIRHERCGLDANVVVTDDQAERLSNAGARLLGPHDTEVLCDALAMMSNEFTYADFVTA